jgi:hypothetical protein
MSFEKRAQIAETAHGQTLFPTALSAAVLEIERAGMGAMHCAVGFSPQE